MIKFFETLVDPYINYQDTDHPPRKLWPFLRDYARPFHGVFALCALFSIAVAVIEITLIWYMGHLVDLLGTTTPSAFWDVHGAQLILAAIGILFVRPLVQLLDVALLNNAILPNFGALVRWRAHRQVLRQSVGWFENDFAGRIANRIMQTPGAAGDAIFQVFDALTFSVAYLIGAVILLHTADPRLAIPLIAWLALYIGLVRWTVTRIGPASEASANARSMTTGRVVDSYSNIQSVKLFAQHNQELDYAKDAIEQTRQTFGAEMRIFTKMDLGLTVINGVLIVGVVGWALALWMQGEASTGLVAAATALTLRLNAMTGWIMWSLSTFFRALGVVREGMQTITDAITLRDAKDAKPLAIDKGIITLQGLTHHYGKQSGGLSEIDLTIKAGEKIGLVGRSGAGKSTLVRLLLRFYDPDAGNVLIDGQDIAHITQDSLRAQIGMVEQDASLLHRSVAENIAYGRAHATREQIETAARKAHAHDFILGLTDPQGRTGYEAHVGERGVKLSGGQRQRIAIARVILKDAPILILDEATSALDSEVEAQIQETLVQMMEGKTVIAIAHRLSTIARMDRILVLDKGHIAESGSHAALLEKQGIYARYWARQSGGFLQTDIDKDSRQDT